MRCVICWQCGIGSIFFEVTKVVVGLKGVTSVHPLIIGALVEI